MSQLLERITINPKQCGGRPCIRGMRIRVSDVLDLFAAGLSADEILTEMPDLEADDLKAALSYASHKLDHLESNNSVLVSNNNKKKYLLDSLTNNTDKEKNYTLYLVSCYFNPKSAKSIISDLLNEEIKLSNVKILIDRGTAIGRGKNELLKWQAELSDDFQLNIDLQAVNSNDLFHVKAYFLKENNNTHSNLVIGSANLTEYGLIRDYGNTELLFHISDIKFHDDFNQKLDDLVQKSAISLSKIDEFKDDFQDLSKNEKIYFKPTFRSSEQKKR